MKTIKTVAGRRLFVAFAFVAAIVGLARSSIGTCSVVEGDSMYPTFKPNDVVQSRLSFATAQRGDVVIISDDRGERAIKRVIGLPGETVTIHRGFVYINGQRLSEPYLLRHTYTFENDSRILRRMDWRLGKNEYFVMGDNRLESTDSRVFGPVQFRDIHGVVYLPANAEKPDFCGIILTESGQTVIVGAAPQSNQTRTGNQHSNTKS